MLLIQFIPMASNIMDESKMLQRDLECLMQRSRTWLLSFNAVKCKVMHLGHKIPTEYSISDQQQTYKLHATLEVKDLGVVTTPDLKAREQCDGYDQKKLQQN